MVHYQERYERHSSWAVIEFALTKPHDLSADPTDEDANSKGNPVPNYWNLLITRGHQRVKERKSEQFDELIDFAPMLFVADTQSC